MSLAGRFLFSAAMDVVPDRETLFHEVYDTEHVPLILTVPGVISAARFELQPLTMRLGGERTTMDPQGAPRFHALYELESPDVLLPDAWAKAAEQGRWPAHVRPPHPEPPSSAHEAHLTVQYAGPRVPEARAAERSTRCERTRSSRFGRRAMRW